MNKNILKSTLLSLSLISTLSLPTLASAETNSNVVASNKIAVVNVRTIIDKSGLMQNTQKEFAKENKTQIAQFQKSQKELQQKQWKVRNYHCWNGLEGRLLWLYYICNVGKL